MNRDLRDIRQLAIQVPGESKCQAEGTANAAKGLVWLEQIIKKVRVVRDEVRAVTGTSNSICFQNCLQ